MCRYGKFEAPFNKRPKDGSVRKFEGILYVKDNYLNPIFLEKNKELRKIT